MFKFDFHIDDADGDLNPIGVESDQISQSCLDQENDQDQSIQLETKTECLAADVACTEISFDQLLSDLPPFITFSTLQISPTQSLYKRELYDAKYQTYVFSGPSSDPNSMVFQSPSDLVPGVYEGGLKTWECSIDLAASLDNVTETIADHLRRAFRRETDHTLKVLEIGCGTAVPTLSICFQLFCELMRLENSQPETKASEPDQLPIDNGSRKNPALEIVLQDFNSEVLRLLTFPNLLLAYYRAVLVTQQNASREDPTLTLDRTGDLELTPSLKTSFSSFVVRHGLSIHLIHGPWTTFPHEHYDVVYTSETVYAPSSVGCLVDLLSGHGLVLVAAKTVYFGLGGGMRCLEEHVERRGGRVEMVEQELRGVGRAVVRVWVP